MDQPSFKRWWEMHLRVARGQALSSEEEVFYRAGQDELERQEKLQTVQSARAAREQLKALEAEHAALEKRRQQLDSDISSLEAKLHDQNRQLLGVEE